MISCKMQRNYVFKPGRGSKMLEKLENKENIMTKETLDNIFLPHTVDEYNNEDHQHQKTSTDGDPINTSLDIIKGSPPPPTVTRNIILQNTVVLQDGNHELQQHAVSGPFNMFLPPILGENNEEDHPMHHQKTSTDGDPFNTSPDIIEESPPPPAVTRNISLPRTVVLQDGNQEFDQHVTLFNHSETIPSDPLITTIEPPLTLIHDHCNELVRLEDDLYISDDSVADPDWIDPQHNRTTQNAEVDSDDIEPEIKIPKKIKTARWHNRKEETYDRNAQKKYRSQCLPYKNYKKQLQPPKAPKDGNCKCKLNCLLNFTEEDRIQICKSYWGLDDYNRQKDFILMNVTVNTPQRCLVNATRKRTVSRTYFFKINEQKIKVCEKFFKNTLCISNGPINKAFSDVGSSGSFEGVDRRGKHEAHNKTKQEDLDFIKGHIESFPTMESHYCRKSSSKKYLDNSLSISKMYELYEEKCKTASKSPISINVYRNIFCTHYNLDFYKPKKDECLLCHKYNCVKKQGSPDFAIWQQKYEEHISLKEQSREAKEADKIRVNEDAKFMSITLDLQKVLHMPCSNVSLLYYLRKLNVYNATIYEARSPNDGICYLWSEVDGKKGSDEVGTALYLWIKRLPSSVTEISIFSDTCAGQNRNQFLLCLQLYSVQTTHLEVIEHKYLESGHTHMEVDSMHSAIENQMRYMPVLSMIDLCNIIRLARSNRKSKKSTNIKKPYEPVVMDHTEILDLKDLRNNLMLNRSLGPDGERVQWLKIKSFKFEKKRPNIVQYRYDYRSDYKELDVSKKGATETATQTINLRKRKPNVDTFNNNFDYSTYALKKAYCKKLPITKAKKKDLLKMCSEKIIPPELHHWYQNLPEKEGRDILPEEVNSEEDE